MTAPKRRCESSPSPTRRASPAGPPGRGRRHPSKLLVPPTNHHDGPTLVVLTVGGPSQMSNGLITRWNGHASDARVDFCAIQAGAGDRSDGLSDLLLANVPQEASLYVVVRDVGVPDDELQDVLDVLSELEIPLARARPLIANGNDEQSFVPDVCRMGYEDEASPVNAFPVGPATGLSFVDRRKVVAGPAFETMANAMALEEQRKLERSAVAALQNAVNEMGGDLRPFTQERIVNAFNQLQSARHWRWGAEVEKEGLRGAAGVKALRQIVKDLSFDQVAQQKLADPLIQLFAVMGGDRKVCQAALDAAAKLDTYTRSVCAVLTLHVACMERLVRSGAPDRATALDYAARVYRREVLGEIYKRELQALRQAPQYHVNIENRLHSAFEDGMIEMLLGGAPGQPFDEGDRNGADPIVKVVRNLCENLERVTTESDALESFLNERPAWQVWQRKKADRAEAESQQPPK